MVKTQSKTLKVTISGSFKATDREIESFDRVTGIIPALNTEPPEGERLSKADQMVIKRYAVIWVGQAKNVGTEVPKYKRVQRIRQVFVDSIDLNDDQPDAVLSYVGKNIMEMNAEELQDFAAANDLSAIPAYRSGSLTHARRVAWSEYARKVRGAVGPEFMWTNEEFKPNQHEPMIADDEIRVYNGHVATIEETLDRENLAMQGKAKAVVTDPSNSKMTLDQLRSIADEKKIGYHRSIGFEQLYKKVYGVAA